MKILLVKSTLLLCALIASSLNGWATTYKLTQVTSVSSGNKYVFIRNNRALSNTVSSSALQTTNSYSTTGLSGTETYIWKLETATGGFYLKNISQNNYLNNYSSTNMSIGNKSSIWTITFTDGVALISNNSNSDRFLGETTSSSNVYKAYATSNLDSYGHDFTVYILEEEVATSVATPSFSPATGTYTSTQTVTLSCATVGSEIYYTLDGTIPTASSNKYNSAINIGETKTIKAIAKNGSDYSNVASATYTIYPVLHEGTSVDPYTVVDARNALTAGAIDAESDYYVTGIIAKIGTFDNSTGQLTYWISDNGSMTNNVQCYKGKNDSGAAFVAATDLEVGDFATVKGKLTLFGGTTYEFTENNEVVSITPRTKVNIATFTATTTDLIIGETETTTTTVTNDKVGWAPATYTYSSDDETVATVDASGVITAVAKGTANITVTPIVSATDPTYKVGDSKSIEITVGYPSHTALFSINGVIDPANNVVVEEGESITFPINPAAIGSKSFVGWSTAAIDGTQDDVPTVLVNSATMSTSDITYYAVFASSSTGNVTKTDVITSDVTGITGNNYYGWSNLQAENGSTAVYAGNCAGSDNTVQLRSNNNNSGIITTTSGGKVKKVVVDWYSSTAAGRALNIYGKNSAYTFENSGTNVTVSDLYNNSKQGTLLGTIVKGTSTQLAITNDYTYIGIRSADAALYCNSISIDWETTGTIYSSYCTTVVPSEPSTPTVDDVTHTVTLTTTANMAGWRTFAPIKADQNYTANADVYYVSAASSSTVTLVKINDGVPANTPVILHKSTGTTITLTETATAITTPGASNLLAVSTAGQDLGKVYRLGHKSAHGVGFYTYTTNSAPEGIVYIAPSSPASEFLDLDFNEETTGIITLDNLAKSQYDNSVFDLQGRKVTQPTKGLYIVNGKKNIIK